MFSGAVGFSWAGPQGLSGAVIRVRPPGTFVVKTVGAVEHWQRFDFYGINRFKVKTRNQMVKETSYKVQYYCRRMREVTF